jgi:hypothetical protein
MNLSAEYDAFTALVDRVFAVPYSVIEGQSGNVPR